MTDTLTPTFDDVTSADVRPGETPAQARTRRKTDQNRKRRQALREAQRAAEPPAPPTAPRARAETPPEPAPKVGRPAKLTKRQASLLRVLALLAGAVAIANADDARAIKDGAPDLAAALANLAETSPKLGKVIDAMSITGAWGEVAIAAGAILIPIAANHGWFGLLGGPPAEQPAPPEPSRFAPASVDGFGPLADGGFRVEPQPTGQPPADGFGVTLPPHVADGGFRAVS